MPFFRWINDISKRAALLAEAGMAPLAILALAAVIFLSVCFWDQTEAIRNVGLVVAAIVALPIAIWRSRIADWRTRIAERDVWNGQYRQGAEMLGHSTLAVRIAGLHTLRRLVEEHPDEYYIQIVRLCAAFLRNPPPDEHPSPRLRDDVQQAMQIIGQCRKRELEKAEQKRSGIPFVPALFNAQLDRGHFRDADWTDARLGGASLRGANLNGITLTDAHFDGADLSGADFTGGSNMELNPGDKAGQVRGVANKVRGLTQAQLDEACADPDNPPNLQGLRDPETKAPLRPPPPCPPS